MLQTGKTPLLAAAAAGQTPVVQFLLKTALVNGDLKDTEVRNGINIGGGRGRCYL